MQDKSTAGGGARTSTLLPGRDFESRAKNTEQLSNKELIDLAGPDFANCFAIIVQKYPELKHIKEVLPELPEHIKAAIIALIQTNKSEKK